MIMTSNYYRTYEASASSKGGPYFIVRQAYVAVAGDLNAGILLSKLAHLFSKNFTTERDGKRWRATTKQQWELEICLTREKFDKAMTTLKDKRLIETKVMRYKSYGRPMLHIHLNEVELSSRLKHLHAVKVENPLSGKCETHFLESVKHTFLKEQSIEAKVKSKGSCVELSVHAKPPKKSETKMTTGKEALSNLQQKYAEKFGENFTPTKTSQLITFWNYLAPLHNEMGYLKKPSAQEAGQFSHLLKAINDSGRNPATVVRWTLMNWNAFRELVKEEKAATLGKVPTVGAVLKYVSTAINGVDGKQLSHVKLIAKKKEWKTGFVVTSKKP
jgi:hypothetical protein